LPTELREVLRPPEAGESAGDPIAEATLVRLWSSDGIAQDVAHLGFEAVPTTSGAPAQPLLHALLEIRTIS
jgi:hypothetical protein